MRKLFILPAAALLLAGCDSSNSDAVVAPIASVQISDFGQTVEEDGTGQDVFFEIQNTTGRSYYRSAIQTDADLTNGASATISDAVEIPFSTQRLRVSFYDTDGDLSRAQLLARSEFFSVDQLAAAADGQVSLASAEVGGAARFTVVRSAQ